jgi:hypothetical protein
MAPDSVKAGVAVTCQNGHYIGVFTDEELLAKRSDNVRHTTRAIERLRKG